MARNEELFNAVLKGKRKDAARITQEAVDAGANLEELLNDSMIAAMREMGERFSRKEAYVPEMLIAARAMQAGLDIIEPLMTDSGREPAATIAIGTVKGDMHDIGKNLVAMMLKGAGYRVVDLGTNCPKEKFAEAVEQGAQIVMLSALLTTTMEYMKDVVEHLKGSTAKIFIGGAPVTQQYASEIGADGFGEDATDAVKLVDELVAHSA